MAEREKVLILGGTKEAVELAAELVAAGHDVTTSLAGRTAEPEPVAGKVRIGGFSSDSKNGSEGLGAWLTENGITRLIDATHPFAKQISANAEAAARLTGIAFERRTRQPWQKQPGDTWIENASLEEARDAIPANARVLLALGSQHISPFTARNDVHFVIRMVDPPVEPLSFASHELVLGKPSSEMAEEKALLQHHAITHIVCRNSGGTGAYAKIEAARELGLPVIIIRQD